MRKLRRFFFVLFFIFLLAGSNEDLIPRASATSTMTVSESCVAFIKEVEGFSSKPYYDYKQHTVGYGTKCPSDKYFEYLANGISKSDADILLRETLEEIGETIHKRLIEKYHLTFTQSQFDALASFSFNIGTSWMTYDSTLRNAILRNAAENELVYAFSLYCTAGGNYSSGLVARRLCEANMYLNGIYSQTRNDAHGYVFFDPNGGTLTYRVQGFVAGYHTAPVAEATRTGDVFLAWYTDITGGTQVKELTTDLSGKTLFARWQSSEQTESQDTPSIIVNVTGDVVNIRKGPGTNYGISSQVYRHDVLVVTHVTQLSGRKWGKVQNGWICLEYTNYDDVVNGTETAPPEPTEEPTEEPTVPTQPPEVTEPEISTPTSPDVQTVLLGVVRVNDGLRVRSGPGTGYATVGYLYNGDTVGILEQKAIDSTTWGRISTGWVCMDYIATNILHSSGAASPKEDPPQQSQPEQSLIPSEGQTEAVTIEGTVIADALRIRSGPDTSNPIVGFYYQDDTVVVSEQVLTGSSYWGKTDRGWINMNYVLPDASAEETVPADLTGEKTVIADCLRVRKQTSVDSRIAELLYYGDKVTVLETTTVDGTLWGRLHNGWICMDYVN